MKKPYLFLILIFTIASTAFATGNQQQMQLNLVDPNNGMEDFTFIYFAPGTTTTYAYPEDAAKSIDTAQGVPQVYSFSSDNVACYSNGYGNFTATTVIALGLRASADTTYILSLAGCTNFDASTLVVLEDRQLGTFTNLRTNSYTLHIYQAGGVNNRFYLHVTFPPAVTTTASGCDNNSGVVTVTQDSSVQWSTCTLYDSVAAVKTYNNIAGSFTFSSLPQGAYSVVFVYNTYQSAKPARVEGHQIEVSISASAIHAAVGEAINFFSSALNTSNYFWQFGDSTDIGGIANPSYTYTDAGYYAVSLTATNIYGCSVTTSLNVDISATAAISNIHANAVTITNDNNNLQIGITDVAGNNYNYQLYNVSGQMLRTGPVTSPDFVLNLSGMASGIYLVSVKSNAGTYTKKIVVSQ